MNLNKKSPLPQIVGLKNISVESIAKFKGENKMKKNLLAIMNENNWYLRGFKESGEKILAYSATWDFDFEHALLVDWDVVKENEENTEGLRKWADVVDGKLVVIEIDYKVTELDSGEERHGYIRPEITQDSDELLQQLIGGESDED